MAPRSRGAGRGGRGRGASRISSDDRVPSSETPSQNDPDSTQAQSDKTEATTSIVDIPSGRSTPASSRTPQASATTSRATSRFKPKNVRRDEAERRKLEEDRNRDLASKIKAEERELRAEERRARRGRGRGGVSRGLIRRTVTANGPFSAISSENVKTDSGHGGWASGSGFGGRNAQNAFRHDPENRIRYHPRREHEARVNIDLLNGLTDGHAPDGTPMYQPNRYTQKSVGNLPIGMHRTLYQDPEVKVKTQAELEAEDRQSPDDDGNLFVDEPARDPRDIAMDNDNEVWHAAPSNQVTVKAEPGTEDEGVDIDMAGIPEAPKAPPSPEVRKKPTIGDNGLATDAATERAKRREKKIAEDPEFMYSTMDLESLLRNLSFMVPDGDEEGQGKEDQLFIFQFPPILPPLLKPSDGLDGQPETIDLASGDSNSKVKVEEGIEAARNNKSIGLPAEGGFIGRLNVRKSGKVELDWGGTTLNLGMETETDFLTTAMIIEQKENVETAEESAGYAYGMGQVFGKFVLAPPCEDEDEWDPNIDDIMLAAASGYSV
ncbi:hypothetical protein O1611_g5786 [Lasiodiplodia mahajangana]|uniref:Uncharacterized protein n=1 Tax=Lasiodiplodia mahajangana TaxID=1108764 RepID=A0ACC2JK02_9PEZI|nr:hypothetical protein O1611_g5786 [Lasiodiplodia mahajangana]